MEYTLNRNMSAHSLEIWRKLDDGVHERFLSTMAYTKDKDIALLLKIVAILNNEIKED